MTRTACFVALVASVGISAGAYPAAGRAAGIARPNPALVSLQVDYVNPLRSASGAVAALPALEPAVIPQALADQAYLAYQRQDDLGGFLPAPLGQQPLSSGGHAVVGVGVHQSQIPNYAQAAGGQISSFAYTGGPVAPPEPGTTPVPGLGPPPPIVPPTNTITPPPPNQGFGGVPTPPPTPTTTESLPTTTAPTTTTKPPPPPPPPPSTTTTTTTTTTTPTTTPTTTTVATTTTSAPPPPPPPSPGCGTTGLRIVSDLPSCRIYAVNMAPGDSTSEHVTITNEADVPFDLSLQVAGTTNRLWDDLELGVWQTGTAAPSPLPPLLWWTTQPNTLATLRPGESISLTIELYLPASAGNADQGRAASIDLIWRAAG